MIHSDSALYEIRLYVGSTEFVEYNLPDSKNVPGDLENGLTELGHFDD